MHRCSHLDALQAVPINAGKSVLQALMPVAKNAGSLEAKNRRPRESCPAMTPWIRGWV